MARHRDFFHFPNGLLCVAKGSVLLGGCHGLLSRVRFRVQAEKKKFDFKPSSQCASVVCASRESIAARYHGPKAADGVCVCPHAVGPAEYRC